MNIRDTSPFLNEDILEVFEKFWGFGIPKDYRNFLLKYNGGYPDKKYFNFKNSTNGSVLQNLLGITHKENLQLLYDMKYNADRYPPNMIPIGDDTCGNRILLSVKGPDRGKIYFWNHEMEANTAQGEVPDYSNLTLIADSFEEFINSLREEDQQ